jgi:hypothetical protein
MTGLELKQILEDLRRYFEFQKTLGLESVVVARKRDKVEDTEITKESAQVEKNQDREERGCNKDSGTTQHF